MPCQARRFARAPFVPSAGGAPSTGSPLNAMCRSPTPPSARVTQTKSANGWPASSSECRSSHSPDIGTVAGSSHGARPTSSRDRSSPCGPPPMQRTNRSDASSSQNQSEDSRTIASSRASPRSARARIASSSAWSAATRASAVVGGSAIDGAGIGSVGSGRGRADRLMIGRGEGGWSGGAPADRPGRRNVAAGGLATLGALGRRRSP